MDDPGRIRSKAALFFENAALTAREAEKLRAVGRQLELWADELDEMARVSGHKAWEGAKPDRSLRPLSLRSEDNRGRLTSSRRHPEGANPQPAPGANREPKPPQSPLNPSETRGSYGGDE